MAFTEEHKQVLREFIEESRQAGVAGLGDFPTEGQRRQAIAQLSEDQIQLLSKFHDGDVGQQQVLSIVKEVYPNRDEETDIIQIGFDVEWILSKRQEMSNLMA